MSTVLNLKLRSVSPQAMTLDMALVKVLRDLPADKVEQGKERLWQVVVSSPADTSVHDKQWLEMICNWVPQGRETQQGREAGALPLTEMARWFELARRVNRLDDTKTGKFTLSTSQAELIFKRLCDPRFELTGISIAWAEFAFEFFTAYGAWPAGHIADDDFDTPFEEDPAQEKRAD